MTRGTYNTRQKRDLLAFLDRREADHYSLDDLVFELKQNGQNLGRSTVYRFLEQLAEQGTVRKYQNLQGVTMYQLVGKDSDCDAHFHMMCSRCGTLYHVSCELMNTLAGHIRAEHGFVLDPRESILVGICEACGKEEHKDGADHSSKCNCGI